MRNGTATSLAGAALAFAVGIAGDGLAHAQEQPGSAQPEPGPGQEVTTCPEVMQGVKVSAEAVKKGVALEFTTPRQERVKELRYQLRELGRSLEEESKAGPGVERAPQGAEEQPTPEAAVPPLDIAVEDIDSGARVIVRAERSGDVQQLRELGEGFEQFWATTDCVQGAPGTQPGAAAPGEPGEG